MSTDASRVAGVDVPNASGGYTLLGERYQWLKAQTDRWYRDAQDPPVNLRGMAGFLVAAEKLMDASRALIRNGDVDSTDTYAMARMEDLYMSRVSLVQDYLDASGYKATGTSKGSTSSGKDSTSLTSTAKTTAQAVSDSLDEFVTSDSPLRWVALFGVILLMVVISLVLIGTRRGIE